MATTPKTNVVGTFATAQEAQTAANDLQRAGFHETQIGVAAQADRTMVSVEADDRHPEAAASLESQGANDVQRVAR
jgi:hypothetical protein